LRNVLVALGIVALVIIALAVGVSLGSKHDNAGSSSSGTPAGSSSSSAAAPAPQASAAALPSGGQQYATDMQNTFSFGSGVQETDIATFGQEMCQVRQSGTTVAGEVPQAQQGRSNTSPVDAVQMITLAELDMCPSRQTGQTVTCW
jgi:hypothetical protein